MNYEDSYSGMVDDAHHTIMRLRKERDKAIAERDALRAELEKVSLRQRLELHVAKSAREAWFQERENATLLYMTLSRHAPQALEAIRSELHESTHETDKVNSRAGMYREKLRRMQGERDELRDQVAALEAERDAANMAERVLEMRFPAYMSPDEQLRALAKYDQAQYPATVDDGWELLEAASGISVAELKRRADQAQRDDEPPFGWLPGRKQSGDNAQTE